MAETTVVANFAVLGITSLRLGRHVSAIIFHYGPAEMNSRGERAKSSGIIPNVLHEKTSGKGKESERVGKTQKGTNKNMNTFFLPLRHAWSLVDKDLIFNRQLRKKRRGVQTGEERVKYPEIHSNPF